MASKIQGLTVKLFGDASELNKAMENSKKKARELNSEIYQINQALKIDPNNNLLYSQKHNALQESLKNAQEELKNLTKIRSEAVKQFANGKIGQDEMDHLSRKIAITRKEIKGLETQIANTIKSASRIGEITAQLKQVDEKANQAKNRIKSIEDALKIDPRNIDLLKQRQDAYSQAIEVSREKIRLLKEGQREAAESVKRNGTGKEEYEKFTQELAITESQLKHLIKESSNAAKKLKDISRDIQQIGEGFSRFGDMMNRRVTLPIAGGAAAIVKAGEDIESAMTGVRKTTDLSDTELQRLEDGFRDLSKEMPASAVELAGIAEIAGQLGIEKENLGGFAEVMAMLGISTNLTAEEGADKLARFMNITGLTHDKIKNLGSAIVYLGNNYATTEAEIVEMGQRLAAQGSMIGLTDAEIMALAASMSAVGLNAEAGGSAMTRILQRMNETGRGLTQLGSKLDNIFAGTKYKTSDLIKLFSMTPSDMNKGLAALSDATGLSVMHLKDLGKQYVDNQYKLSEFAKVAGTTPEVFADMFRNAPTEALTAFMQGLKRINESGGDVSATLEQMGIKGIREKDTIQRLTKAADMMNRTFVDADREFESNTALQKEAELRYEDTASKVQMLKNRLNDLAIELSEILLPIFNGFLEKASDFVSQLSDMDQQTLEQIVKVAGVAAAIGPVSKILGGTLMVLGKGIPLIAEVVSGFSGAVGAAGSFGGALKAAAGFIFTPKVGIIAAIAALGFVAYQVAQDMKEKAFTSDLLDGLSEGTQKAVGGFLELEKEAEVSLSRLKWSGDKLSKEAAESISGNFSSMSDTLKGAFDDKKSNIGDLFVGMPDLKATSEEEMNHALILMSQYYDEQEAVVEEYEYKATQILQKASNEKRALTAEELTEINNIKRDMKQLGIETLSESEEEANLILQRMKEQHSEISAEQAAEVVKQSAEQRDQTVENALQEYNERMSIIRSLKNSSSKESQELAKKLEFDANYAKTKAIENAEQMHRDVVDEAKKQAGEHVDEIDWETGEVLSRWDRLKKKVGETADEIGIKASGLWSNFKELLGNIQQKADEWNIKIEEFEKSVNETVGGLVDNVVEFFSKMPERISQAIGDLWSDIKRPFEEAAENIKGIFDFDIKLPKLPHIKFNNNNKNNPGFPFQFPKISWYKKGAIFTKPTIFNTPYGLKGVGEAGAEAVLPLNELYKIIEGLSLPNKEAQQPVNINIEEMVVRDEYDINKISNELFRLIERRNRGIGNV